eukprot:3453239-Rhodomonas_salina.1
MPWMRCWSAMGGLKRSHCFAPLSSVHRLVTPLHPLPNSLPLPLNSAPLGDSTRARDSTRPLQY